MNISDDKDRFELGIVARSFFSKVTDPTRVRAALLAEGLPDPGMLASFAEMGWLGMEVAEEFGGAGASLRELATVIEAAGAAAASDVLVASSVLCAGALQHAGQPAQKQRWLPALASGEAIGAVVLPPTSVGSLGTPVRATVGTDGWTLNGSAPGVLAARTSDLLVVLADTGGALIAVAVESRARGVRVTPTPMLDRTRCLDRVDFDRVAIGAAEVLTENGTGGRLLATLLNRAAVAMAADAVGNAQATLDMTVRYIGQREQFGRPIGSFQAVKHRAADMFVDLETSRALTAAAAQLVATQPADPTASVASSMAKEYACEKSALVAGAALQLHGGIGYTWEHDLHIYLKRAKLTEQLFGGGAWHRERVAQQLLGSG